MFRPTGKQFGVSKARWPLKSAQYLLDLLKNAEANADAKGLDTGALVVRSTRPPSSAAALTVPTVAYVFALSLPRTRTTRLRDSTTTTTRWLTHILQINPYMSNPCHIELILTEGEEVVQKSDQVVGREELRLNSRQRGARVRKAITAA